MVSAPGSRGRRRAPRCWPAPRWWVPRGSCARSPGRRTGSVKLADELDVVLDEQDREALLGLHLAEGLGEGASVSARSRPDDGSSSSSTLGSVIRARPTSTRRHWPEAQPLDRLARRGLDSSEQLEHLVAAGDLLGGRDGRGRRGPSRAGRLAAAPARRRTGGRGRWSRGRARCAGRCGPSPSRARRCTGIVGDVLARRARRVPPSMRSTPSMQLKNVVLPAPFGPISPTRSPSPISMLAASRATMPENFLVASVTFRIGLTAPAPPAASSQARTARGRSARCAPRFSIALRPSACASGTRGRPRDGGRTGSHRSRTARTPTCGEIGRKPGMRSGSRRIQPKIAPLRITASNSVNDGRGHGRALDGARR